MTPVEVGDLTEEAGRRGRVLGVRLPVVEDEDEAPWLAPPSRRKPDASITGPLPETVEVVLGDQVYVDRTGLVLVHRRQLLDQWVARLGSFLDQRPEQIGRIGGGKRGPTGVIDVAVIQSLVRKGEVDDIVADYGHLVVDECHHVSAVSFEAVARRCKARYVLGLSATATRKDGHHPIIFMQCGPDRSASASMLVDRPPSVQPSGRAPHHALRAAGGVGPRSTAHPTHLWGACRG